MELFFGTDLSHMIAQPLFNLPEQTPISKPQTQDPKQPTTNLTIDNQSNTTILPISLIPINTTPSKTNESPKQQIILKKHATPAAVTSVILNHEKNQIQIQQYKTLSESRQISIQKALIVVNSY